MKNNKITLGEPGSLDMVANFETGQVRLCASGDSYYDNFVSFQDFLGFAEELKEALEDNEKTTGQKLNEAQCCLSRAATILKGLGLMGLAIKLRKTENQLRQISDLVIGEIIKAAAEEQIAAKEEE